MHTIIGFHAIEEALKQGSSETVLHLHVKSHKRNEQLLKAAKKYGVRTISSTPSELDRLAEGRNHRGAVLMVAGGAKIEKQVDLKEFLSSCSSRENALVLLLDGVTDPQNLGAVLRSADQFSVDLVIIPDRRSAGVNGTVMKVSAGAAAYVPVATVKNLSRTLALFKEEGFWIYGADMGGESVDSVSLTGKTVIVLGAEGAGLSRLIEETCDVIVSIPTAGHIDSLNISVAAGILLYEARRQGRRKR